MTRRTKDQIIAENEELRARLAALEDAQDDRPVALNVRIPRRLHALLRARAVEEGRTLRQITEAALEAHLQAPEGQ